MKFGRHVINTENGEVEIEADDGNLKKIREFPEPESKNDMASFIGIIKP